MNASQRSQIRSDVVHLTAACPHDGANPPFCPLHEVRKLSAEGRIKWIHTLADADLEYIAAYHPICLKWRAAVA